MLADANAARILQALPEPALLVGTDGHIAFANHAAIARLGIDKDGEGDLVWLTGSPEAAAELRSYLLRCSGSRSPLLGAAELRNADGRFSRFRLQNSVQIFRDSGVPPCGWTEWAI